MADAYTSVTVDFNKTTGPLRHALHCDGHTPSLAHRNLIKKDDEFRAMNFSAARTHDWALANGGQRIIDTHFVFPLEHLDPADPTNYYFTASDKIIQLCRNVGMKVFYRLGTSIEHSADWQECNYVNHFNTHPPKDPAHYAEILAGIIRHYTRGWANGFEYKDMEYWEIWNEPDLIGRMWCGNREQFVEFFVTVLKRLKSEFPELKIGGPALTALNLDYFGALLDGCKEAGVAPDFISWHCYANNVRYIVDQAQVARDFLDERGLTECETCLNEWHFILGGWEGVQSSASSLQRKRAIVGPCSMFGIDSAAFNLSVLCEMQNTPLDSAFYYGHSSAGMWSYYDEYAHPNKNNFSMRMFGRFLAEANEKVETLFDPDGSVHALGALAKNGKDGKMIVVDYRGETPTLEVDVAGMEDCVASATVLDDGNDIVPVPVIWDGSHLILTKPCPGSAAFYVTFKKN